MEPQTLETTSTSTNTSEASDIKVHDTPKSADEILRRVKPDTKPSEDPSDIDSLKINPNDLDQIKDPMARKMVEERYKLWEKGFNQKFEQIAGMRKQMESQLAQSQNWTPEKLKEEIKKPEFLQSAQALQRETAPSGWEGSQDEWSALTPNEKAKFEQLSKTVFTQQAQLSRMVQAQEDEKLVTRYPDYNPKAIDQLQQDLISGRLVATREHLYKVLNFDKAVTDAYRLGKEDRNLGIAEKVNATVPFQNLNVRPSNDVPEDVMKGGFQAVAKWRLAQSKLKKS